MDTSNAEHSDSDSGDSWTLLDDSPSYAEEAPENPENHATHYTDIAEHTDKDDDTDGISIISDSDVESPVPETPHDVNNIDIQEPHSIEEPIQQYILEQSHSCHKSDENLTTAEFLGDSNGKLRTYVHRRNKRLSTVLNIIVLGSIITAAGVAIGHMWGVRDECVVQTAPSVNKILSNLYKLQEENVYLRNKLKEFTLASQKNNQSKIPRHSKCRKVFEESLNKKNVERLTKCVDFDTSNTDKVLESHLVEPDFEKEFTNDIDKLRMMYRQNKSWLDEEIARRQKIEKQTTKQFINSPKMSDTENSNKPATENLLHESADVKDKKTNINVLGSIVEKQENIENKISYADSVKSHDPLKVKNTENINSKPKDISKKKRAKRNLESIADVSISEEDIVKDNRYVATKPVMDKIKHDRHKGFKKQKRRNKFANWEIKSGYKHDYDDISLISLQEADLASKNNKHATKDIYLHDYIVRPSHNYKYKDNEVPKNVEKTKEMEPEWYEKRMTLRSEARKKLEKELFGDNLSNAGWYFRRMKRREQCRVKSDNATYRKQTKRNMNFKTKH